MTLNGDVFMARREKRIVNNFKPEYLEDFDFRYGAARKIRRVYRDLKKQCDINSRAKDILARHAAFLTVKLETLQVQSLTGKGVSESKLLTTTNSLVGILKQLGLEDLSEAGNRNHLKEFLARKERLAAEKAERKRRREARRTNSRRPVLSMNSMER
jgi:hypothetical protein